MKTGKVPNDILNKLILSKINNFRQDVILRPGIGEDCTAIDFGQFDCVISTDPITGAINEIGKLSVHISCNDIASSGVEPLGLMVTLLCPTTITEKELEFIMDQICATSKELNVEILGGHTEVTPAVNRVVISTTAIGKAPKGRLITSNGAKVGDSVLITKFAGLEGTAIIANDFEDVLKQSLDAATIQRAKSFINQISVVKEGVLAGELGVSAMHDVTEGGVLGAAWEIAEASGLGIIINKNDIPVDSATLEICKLFSIDPLRLISSGSMIIATSNADELFRIYNEHQIPVACIGKITPASEGRFIYDSNTGLKEELVQSDSDELYKLEHTS